METKLTFPVYMLLGDLAVMDYHPIHFMLVDENDDGMKVRIDVPAKFVANSEEIIKAQLSANSVSHPILNLEGLQFCYNSITQAMRHSRLSVYSKQTISIFLFCSCPNPTII